MCCSRELQSRCCNWRCIRVCQKKTLVSSGLSFVLGQICLQKSLTPLVNIFLLKLQTHFSKGKYLQTGSKLFWGLLAPKIMTRLKLSPRKVSLTHPNMPNVHYFSMYHHKLTMNTTLCYGIHAVKSHPVNAKGWFVSIMSNGSLTGQVFLYHT